MMAMMMLQFSSVLLLAVLYNSLLHIHNHLVRPTHSSQPGRTTVGDYVKGYEENEIGCQDYAAYGCGKAASGAGAKGYVE